MATPQIEHPYVSVNPALAGNVASALASLFPVASDDGKWVLQAKNIRISTEKFDAEDLRSHQRARVEAGNRTIPISADLELIHEGKTVSRRSGKIGDLPLMGVTGSFVVGGNDWFVPMAQQRRKPGAYTREKSNGEFETAISVPKLGMFKLTLDPEKGVFKFWHRTTSIDWYGLVKALGATDDEVAKAIGPALLEVNKKTSYDKDVDKLYASLMERSKVNPHLVKAGILPEAAHKSLDPAVKLTALKQALADADMDPFVTSRTLGAPHTAINKDMLLAAARRIAATQRGDEAPDDPDAPEFKTAEGVDDLMAERIRGKVGRYLVGGLKRLLGKETDLTKLVGPTWANVGTIGYFGGAKGFEGGLAHTADIANPLALLSERSKLTLMGDGGIQEERAITDAARLVRPTAAGFIDLVHTPEGFDIGVTTHAAANVKKTGKTLSTLVYRVKGGIVDWKTPVHITTEEAADAVVSYPEFWSRETGKPLDTHVRANVKGAVSDTVDPMSVAFVLPSGASMFDHTSNAALFLANTHAVRGMMAGKHLTQALPLVNREIPLAVPKTYQGQDLLRGLGQTFTIQSKVDGVVESVKPDCITVSGTKHWLFDHYPMQAKVGLHHIPVVKVGDTVKKGQLLADTNYSRDGRLALGVNLRSAYTPWRNGGVYEDAIPISESAAQKLSSEHIHRETLWLEDGLSVNSKLFMAQYPTQMTAENLAKLDDTGVIKVGQQVKPHEVLVAAVKKREFEARDKSAKNLANIHKMLQRPYSNAALVWDEDFIGTVLRVTKLSDRIEVHLKTIEPVRVGDKLSMSSAAKGTVSAILPDDKMPRDEKGRPIEVIFNPIGVHGRINPSQTIEQAAGKLVRDGGEKFEFVNFEGDPAAEITKRLKAKGLKHEEFLFDPTTGRKTERPVGVGYNYVLKLDHPVRKKFSARGRDGYTMDEAPTSGKGKGGQSFDQLTTYALLGHDAHAILGESAGIRGSRNDDFWEAYQAGEQPPPPKVPFAFEKLRNYMTAMGIHTEQSGNTLHYMPITDKKVMELSNGEIRNARQVRAENLAAEKGGLFDEEVTGGVFGCFHETSVVWTEAGEKTIKEVVKRVHAGEAVRVWSYDFGAGKWVLKRVTRGWINKGQLGRASFGDGTNPMPSVRNHAGHRVVWATPGHQMLKIDGTKEAISDCQTVLRVVDTFSQAQMEILVGHLLGDGHISQQGNLSIARTFRDIEYLKYTKEVLAWLGGSLRVWTDRSGGLVRKKAMWRSKNAMVLHGLREAWYPKGKKVVPSHVRDLLTPRALAIWFQDDGCVVARKDRPSFSIRLCTHGFTEADTRQLSAWLLEKYSLAFAVRQGGPQYEGRDIGYILHASGETATDFLALIAPYVHPSMSRKLGHKPTQHRCILCGKPTLDDCMYCTRCLVSHRKAGKKDKLYYAIRHRYGTRANCPAVAPRMPDVSRKVEVWNQIMAQTGTLLPVSPDPVRTLHAVPVDFAWAGPQQYFTARTVYDLEVEGTHNYVVNGLLVSNSHWAHIELGRQMPHPLYEKVVRELCGLTQAEFYGLLGETMTLDPRTGKIAVGGTGLTGAAAFKKLLSFDIDAKLRETKEKLKTAVGSDANKYHRITQYLRGLKKSGLRPEDAYLTSKLPVVPPKYRSIIELPTGVLKVADANLLYRDAVLTRNMLNEAEKDKSLPPSELGKARLALYDTYAAVVGVGKPLTERRDEDLRGFAQIIKGKTNKTGLFQSQLARRRNDFTGRSTIEPDASLGPDEIGIPEEMAWTINEPIVVRNLVSNGWSPAEAAEEVRKRTMAARNALNAVLATHPVIYSRAPSLHRWSTGAAMPRIVAGKEIKISPLVVGPFNADYDGDTMFVHPPITEPARQEAFNLLPSKNLIYDKDRSLAYSVDKDIIAGVFALTRKGRPSGASFKTSADAIQAYQDNKQSLFMDSIVKVEDRPGQWTIGQLIFFSLVPPQFSAGLTMPVDGEKLKNLLTRVAKEAPAQYNTISRKITQAGFEAAARAGGITATVQELVLDRGKVTRLLKSFQQELAQAKNYKDKQRLAVKLYNEKYKPQFTALIKEHIGDEDLGYGALVASGASKKNLQNNLEQILISPGLVQDVHDEVVPAVIGSSYGAGMRPSDYLLTSPGARAGQAARSLMTAKPGYLAKEIAASMGPVRIGEPDCKTQHGIEAQLDEPDVDLLDRHLLKDIPGTTFRRNDVVTPEMLSRLRGAKKSSIWIRSPMTCESSQPPCQMCAGRRADGKLHPVGSNIGYNYGQAVSERSTQLTMKMFHSGGAYGAGHSLKSGFARLQELLKAPDIVSDQGTIATVGGKISNIAKAPQGGNYIYINGTEHYAFPARKVLVKVGQSVSAGDALTDGSLRPQDIAKYKGSLAAQQYVVTEARNAYQQAGATVRRPVLEVLAAGVMRYAKITDDGGESDLAIGDILHENDYKTRKARNPKVTAEPVVLGLGDKPLVTSNDLLERLNFEHLTESLQQVPAIGGKSDLTGSKSPIPGLAYGAAFRRSK